MIISSFPRFRFPFQTQALAQKKHKKFFFLLCEFPDAVGIALGGAAPPRQGSARAARAGLAVLTLREQLQNTRVHQHLSFPHSEFDCRHFPQGLSPAYH